MATWQGTKIPVPGVNPHEGPYYPYCWWLKSCVHHLRMVVCPIICRVSYIPGGARFQPSTVWTLVQHTGHLLHVLCGLFLAGEKRTTQLAKPRKCNMSFFVAHENAAIFQMYQMEKYFTNLDCPEIRGFPLLNHRLGPRSCEVAIIWPDIMPKTLFFLMKTWHHPSHLEKRAPYHIEGPQLSAAPSVKDKSW